MRTKIPTVCEEFIASVTPYRAGLSLEGKAHYRWRCCARAFDRPTRLLPHELGRKPRVGTRNPEFGIFGNPAVEGAFQRYAERLVKPDIFKFIGQFPLRKVISGRSVYGADAP